MIGEDNRKSLRKPEELKYVDYECKNGVAGFSAFFIQLDPVVQEEIIKRTELSFE